MPSLKKALIQLVLLFAALIIVIVIIKAGPLVWKTVYPLQHQEVICSQAVKYNLDPSLIAAVINVESRFRAHAVSPKGAKGLMQLMPATAEWVAEQSGLQQFTQDDLLDPATNITMGSWYLANLLNQFDGNLIAAIAAYNGGRGNVKSWLDKETWDGTLDGVENIPFNETRRYVQKVYQQFRIYSRLYSWPESGE